MAAAVAGNVGVDLRRWLRLAVIGFIGLVGLVFLAVAALAVFLVGLAVAAAAFVARALRAPPRAEPGPPLLEARRLPDGWTAEPR